MKTLISKNIILKIVLVALIVFVDLLTKVFFKNIIAMSCCGRIVIIDGLLELIYVENTGASWGIFASHTLELAILSIVFISAIVVYDIIAKEKSLIYTASFVCLVGGGIGNLNDRLLLGYVRDFIGVANWFVCNVADIFVTVGVILYLIFIIYEDKNERKNDVAI